ncbi:MAG: putative DNA modification/repair radical SAM protein [Syntrophomonas sp.]|nr:putative DNA modification/repair radical SAM protein [Syntrophomonas sp.]
MDVLTKLDILAGAAKFDVSCSSSGVARKNQGGTGNAKLFGICHTWSADGRCISLLKVLLSNDCVYDCCYCVSRRSNNIPRASFTSRELADLTLQFYRRNYIEGLFLSSAVEKSPDHTMEKIIQVLTLLRKEYEFHGYIHVKVIPGADPSLINRAGMLCDRMSVNIEQPTEHSLRLLAPQKSLPILYASMQQLKDQILLYKDDRRHFHRTPRFVPGGQSTQMIVGASQDNDLTILHTTQALYKNFGLKRVYFSAYVPVNQDSNLPALTSVPPLLREHRLYQSDWLLRFYHFKAEELVDANHANLETEIDPKSAWALRHPEYFPLEINRASYEELLRVPGIGTKSAWRIINQRRVVAISADQLKKLGVVFKRAQYFVTCKGIYPGNMPYNPAAIRRLMLPKPSFTQMSLF